MWQNHRHRPSPIRHHFCGLYKPSSVMVGLFNIIFPMKSPRKKHTSSYHLDIYSHMKSPYHWFSRRCFTNNSIIITLGLATPTQLRGGTSWGPPGEHLNRKPWDFPMTCDKYGEVSVKCLNLNQSIDKCN